MGKILRFRCTDENCPANYTLTAVSEQLENELATKGAFSQINAGRCRVCGKLGIMFISPPANSVEQKAEHERLLKQALSDLQKATEMIKQTFTGKSMGAGNAG